MSDVMIDVRVDCYSGKSAENEVHDAFYIEQRDQRLCILCIEELMHHSKLCCNRRSEGIEGHELATTDGVQPP